MEVSGWSQKVHYMINNLIQEAKKRSTDSLVNKENNKLIDRDFEKRGGTNLVQYSSTHGRFAQMEMFPGCKGSA